MRQKKIQCLIFSFFLFNFYFAKFLFAEDLNQQNPTLSITPNQFYEEDDIAVHFEYSPNLSSEKIYLVEINPMVRKNVLGSLFKKDPSVFKPHWELNDEGLFGDKMAGDKIFGRNVQFKEKVPRIVQFMVLKESQLSQMQQIIDAQSSAIYSIQVLARPSFIEVLQKIYQKIKNQI